MVATGMVANNILVGGANTGSYTFTHVATGHFQITFNSLSFTSVPDPLEATCDAYYPGTQACFADVAWSSLSPLTWHVYTYNASGTATDYSFTFALMPGGS